ncbi:MAG: hypothetical protein JWP91_2883 [Fibrobacteres bacterium]|nr:hypothetical protein [Fibrobacterota bacterium]
MACLLSASFAAFSAESTLAASKPSGPAALPEAQAGPAHGGARPGLAVLDPVDVGQDRALSLYGDLLRTGLKEKGRFTVVPRGEMDRKMAEFNWPASAPCHEFQCGFDAGNLLLTEYVFFGSITAVDGLFAYTFNILHVPTSQVVFSEAGDVPGNAGSPGDGPLKARLSAFLSGLDPARFDISRKTSRGLMAVVDGMSGESPESKVLSERVATHVLASRHYDLMSRKELQELVAAMDLRPDSAGGSDSEMITLGTRLNVAYLIRSRLREDARGSALDLALYDIAGKRRVRDWPSGPKRDFKDILHLENRFFATLSGPAGDLAMGGEGGSGGKSGTGGHGLHSRWKQGVLSALGVSAAAGLTALAFGSHQDADRAHGRAESAYSLESAEDWQAITQEKDRRTVLFGALAAVSLGASVVIWTF